ncbi:MAG: hypothetical protein WD070_10965, partial [Pirellulaceae bacterium]
MTESAIDIRLARRSFLGRTSLGLGSAALGSLLNLNSPCHAAAAAGDLASLGVINPLHLPPKVKRVIFL